jgi:hypothetical protein
MEFDCELIDNTRNTSTNECHTNSNCDETDTNSIDTFAEEQCANALFHFSQVNSDNTPISTCIDNESTTNNNHSHEIKKKLLMMLQEKK